MARDNQKSTKKKQDKNLKNHLSIRERSNSSILNRTLSEIILILLIAFGVGVLHSYHVGTLFENDRYFSHLSTLEREMTLRTEQGLYYSYFKTMAEAPSFFEGLKSLYRDEKTEYPSTINVLKRFNLYPEVVIGGLHRIYTQTSAAFKKETKICFKINRGEGLSPVTSCEGLGDPAIFYVSCVWVISGLTTAALFLLSVEMSDSFLSGVVTVAAFFFNHGECTRVQWTPALRESFAFPFCILQILTVSIAVKSQRGFSPKMALAIAWTSTVFVIQWQFAQFDLLTQLMVLYLLQSVDILRRGPWFTILYGLLMGYTAAFLLLFGNRMLLTSWYFSALASALVITSLSKSSEEEDLRQVSLKKILEALPKFLAFVLMAGVSKSALSKVFDTTDDAHVFEILKSKFGDFRNFHTMLYTCAKEFDFLGWEMPEKTTMTLLLPTAVVGLLLVLVKAFNAESRLEGYAETSHIKICPAIAYIIGQTLAFGIMAVVIMRLKLFLTPHLCLLAGLTASRKIFLGSSPNFVLHSALIFALLAAMGYQGFANINKQRSIEGEYSNPPMEELFEWINSSLPLNAAFAGPMPLMANLLLSTRRPIVNHPHYEDSGLRNRTKIVYSIYSRRSEIEVHRDLKDLQIDYLVIARDYCLHTNSIGGCGMTDLWDVEESEYLLDEQGRKKKSPPPPLCPKLFNNPNPKPFKKVFTNREFQILKI